MKPHLADLLLDHIDRTVPGLRPGGHAGSSLLLEAWQTRAGLEGATALVSRLDKYEIEAHPRNN
jgi:hypothetical protein